jgi:DNA invertase Pin-like site-specific DNA recombinase
MKAALYLRQSLDRDQNQLAVARQRADCIKLCKQRKWTPVEYVDNDISASTGKVRPAYQAMLADIRDGKVGAVVAWDADRLHRMPRELEDFIDLADEHKLALATVGGDFDLSTPTGRGNARMKGVFARMEMEQKAVRQRRAGQQKAENGLPVWKRAFGYLDDTHQLDTKTAPLVAQAYTAILAGSSLKDVARLFNRAGAHGLTGKPWSESTVSLFLRAPRNAGLRDYNGEIVGKGTWPPLVEESTWRAAQSVLNAPGRAPGRKSVRQHPLTGVLRCGKKNCDGHLSGQWARQKTGGKPGRPKAGQKKEPHSGQLAHSITYGCKTCRGVSIRAEHIEPLLYRIVSGRLAMPDAVDLLKAEIHDEAEAEKLRTERATLLTRLDEIADERADGLLTGPQAKRATDRITGKLADIEAREQDQERLRVFDGLPLGKPEVAEAIEKLSPDRFRAVLAVLADVMVAPVGKGGYVFNPERVQVSWR